MKRVALAIAVATFVVAWRGRGSGTIGRWLTLIGLLVSERFAALSVPSGARSARSMKKPSTSGYTFR